MFNRAPSDTLKVFGYLPIKPVNARNSAGTSRDKQGQGRDRQGQGRDKQWQTGTFPFCPCLSLLVPVCPCLSVLVLVCPCLSLSVLVSSCLSVYISKFAIPSCLPLQMNIKFFISIDIVTLTFYTKVTVLIHAHLIFLNFFFTSLLKLFTKSFLNKIEGNLVKAMNKCRLEIMKNRIEP